MQPNQPDPFADTQRLDVMDVLADTQRVDVRAIAFGVREQRWFDEAEDEYLPAVAAIAKPCPGARWACLAAAVAALGVMFAFVV